MASERFKVRQKERFEDRAAKEYEQKVYWKNLPIEQDDDEAGFDCFVCVAVRESACGGRIKGER